MKTKTKTSWWLWILGATLALEGYNRLKALQQPVAYSPYPLKEHLWQDWALRYVQVGQGSPLLLIHDINPHLSSDVFSADLEVLAQHHTVYVLNLPGFGFSQAKDVHFDRMLLTHAISDFIREVIGGACHVFADGLAATAVANVPDTLLHSITLRNPAAHSPTSRWLSRLLDVPVWGEAFWVHVGHYRTESRFVARACARGVWNAQLFYLLEAGRVPITVLGDSVLCHSIVTHVSNIRSVELKSAETYLAHLSALS